MGPLQLLTNEEEAGLEATGEDCEDEGELWSWFMEAQSLAQSAMDGPAGAAGCSSWGGKIISKLVLMQEPTINNHCISIPFSSCL